MTFRDLRIGISRAIFDWKSNTPYERAVRGSGENSTIEVTPELARRIYKENPWVSICVDKVRDNIASVKWNTENQEGEKVNHQAQAMLDKPMDSMAEWSGLWALHILLTGEVFAEKVRLNDGDELLALDLHWPGNVSRVSQEVYQITNPDTGNISQVKSEDIQRWKFSDPKFKLKAISPLNSIFNSINIDMMSRSWSLSSLSNSAVASAVIELPEKAILTPDAKKSLRRMTEEGFGGKNAHRPAILTGGAKWKQVSLNSRDLEREMTHKRAIEEICSRIGVPPGMAGASEPKYENYSQSRLSFWEETIIPLLNVLKGGLDQILNEEWTGIFAGFDLSSTPATSETFDNRLESSKKLFDLGYSLNEINERLGLEMENQKWGDTGLLPANLAPAEDLADGIDLSPPQDDDGYRDDDNDDDDE